ncbi:pseudo histidine-containing phosphotransfer protein 6 isoform X2 [Gossypium hirsutum]|uniref:Histidine-containing phosphotransfer protein n=1 Tax=Gossypium hirsutum TaxID=3635 RepID=A0A1U8ITU2_GOSHI|nr:pseudo histidine-containing phosphotransfer protein 6-like isoform X2 [Gossypium hirsutum]
MFFGVKFKSLCLWGFNHLLAKTGLPVWMLGPGADRLRADVNRLLAFLFHQGILDEQFLQLQQLQDESSPNFVSQRKLSDYKNIGIHINQLMGSSSSIGAKRVRNVCVAFRAASDQNNRTGCLRVLEVLEHDYCFLKNKLHELFQIEQQRILAGGVGYPMQN